MNAHELKETLKKGDSFQTYYKDGDKAGIILITRLTDKSIFAKEKGCSEFRYSYNTFSNYINKGYFKKININI